MTRGRKTTGPKLVDTLDGSAQSKRRLRVLLETLNGQKTIAEAAEELGVSEARIHAMRATTLQTALNDLEPKPKGRPPNPEPTADQQTIEQLRHEINELKFDLRAAQVREEIDLLAPHLLIRNKDKAQKAREQAKAIAKKKRAEKRKKKLKRKRKN